MKGSGTWLVFAVLLLGLMPAAAAWDGYSVSLGKAGEDWNHGSIEDVSVLRIGARTTPQPLRFRGAGGPHLSRFWEVELGYWGWSESVPGDAQDLWELAVRPVFRLDFDSSPAATWSPFIEGAIGAHLISEMTVAGRDLSSHFHFGSHAGVGTRLGGQGRYEVVLRLQHLSNAGMNQPNPGINVLLLQLSYRSP